MADHNQGVIYCEEEDMHSNGEVQNTGTGRQVGTAIASASGITNLTRVKPVISEEAHVVKKQLTSFIDTLNEMSAEMELMDVTLKCGDQTFKAHKLILCANSPYFRTMFHSDLSEAKNGIVNLKGVHPETFEIIMKVMYFGSFPPVHDTNKLKSLLAAAHLLHLTNLYEYCCDEYMKGLDNDTFFDIWKTAELYENQKMLAQIPRELTKMFRLVQKSREFLLLSFPQLCKLVKELRNSKHNPDEILKSILYWTKHDHENRNQHLSQLLLLVDLSGMSTSYLSAVLKNEDVKKCTEASSLFMDAAAARLSGFSTHLETNATKLVVVWNTYPLSIYCYDLQKKTWSGHSKTPTNPLGPFPSSGNAQHHVPIDRTLVIVKNLLYCVSSNASYRRSQRSQYSHGSQGVKQLVKYNLQTTSVGVGRHCGQWHDQLCDGQYCCNLLENKASPGLAALAGEIYIVGGTGRNGRTLRSVECYDSVSNRCFQTTPMINPHCTQSVVATSNFLYIADVYKSKITIERYNPKITQWCLVFSQSTVCIRGELIFAANNVSHIKVASCAGKLFFVQNSKLFAYDPDFNSWKQIKTAELSVSEIWGMSNPKIECEYLMLLAVDKQLYQFHPFFNTIRPMRTLQLEGMHYGALTVF